MKKIYESVAFGIVAWYELTELMKDERNLEKKEIIGGTRIAYYYLIDNIQKEFGAFEHNILCAMVELGYEYRMAARMLDDYIDWAEHVVRINENGDGT